MNEPQPESVLQKPPEKTKLLQLAFGEGTTKKGFLLSFGGWQHINRHQPRRFDSIR